MEKEKEFSNFFHGRFSRFRDSFAGDEKPGQGGE
jgi:hypothetical protein